MDYSLPMGWRFSETEGGGDCGDDGSRKGVNDIHNHVCMCMFMYAHTH